ncbi:hypothetical protein G9A89_012912 [Geosiphon pyriformis]|nr:hypothetical protein G9A89_012912 [Geosiphon pyriformis]
MEPGFNIGIKSTESRKKRRGNALEDNVGNRKFTATGNTTESDSVDMEEKFLVEKTSFDYEEGSIIAVQTKRALGKPLGKIDFLDNSGDNILLDRPVVFPLPLKNLVDVSIRKFFTLDISLNNVVRKSAQEKLMVVRKLFSKINGFGETFTPSKFAGIIRAIFTSKLSLAQTSKKAKEAKILVNADLKKLSEHSDRAVVLKKISVGTSTEAVYAHYLNLLVGLWQKAIVKFGKSKQTGLVTVCWSILIKKNAVCVVRTDQDKKLVLLYTLPIGTTAHDIWDFIGSVGEKTCVINCHPVIYVQVRCAIICFESANLLDAIMRTTPVLKSAHFHWFCLGSAVYAKYRKLGHTSLSCVSDRKFSSGSLPCHFLSDADKSQLAAIYVKCSAPVACPVFFDGVSWAKIVGGSLFSSLSILNGLLDANSSLEEKPTPLVFLELNDRFVTLECSLTSLAECVDKLAKRLDTPRPTVFQLSSGWVNIVISESLSVATSGKTIVGVVVFDLSVMSKMEETLKNLSRIVMGLLAKMENATTCNIRGLNNPAKQADVFMSDMDSGYMSIGVAIVMNNFLARHVCKVSELAGCLLSVRLLFKNKLSVLILGLYAGALSGVWFSQIKDINSLIAKAVNESSFVILSDDFNKDSAWKYASFRKCFDLGLVDSLGGNLFAKVPTWTNFCGVAKALNYIFVFSSLGSAIINGSVASVEDYFDTDHKACEFKDATAANTVMFLDNFRLAKRFSNLDAMWDIVCKVMIFSANDVFKKKWFKGYNRMFTKEFSKLHNLEILVSRIVKTSCKVNFGQFVSLLKHWISLDNNKALVVWDLVCFGVRLDCVCFALYGMRRSYCAFKFAKSLMEDFVVNKDHTIHNVLECSFCKVVLDYLVSDGILILNSVEVKSKTRKKAMLKNVPNFLDDLMRMVKDLPDVYCLFNVLCKNNFFVLKGITTQSPIFVIGSVVEDTLEKDCELWLVLQNMCKAYDSDEIFSPLLWRIFYDPLLCKVKRQESFLTLFLVAGAFVDDIIWYILDIASEFFMINDISINNEKTVTIPINQRIGNASLLISGLLISVFCQSGSKKGYFGQAVFYLVSAVLQPIVSYRTQFSFVFRSVYMKWDMLIRRGLKLKSGLPKDFPNKAFHHPSLYGLKFFEQLQTEYKMASVLCFLNAGGVLSHLFNHRSLDLQVLGWSPIHPLCHPVKLHDFLDYDMSFGNLSVTVFCFSGETLMSTVLRTFLFYNVFSSLKRSGVVFAEQLYTKKELKLDPKDLVPCWFTLVCGFLEHFFPSDDLYNAGLQALDVYSSGEVSKLDQCLYSANMEVISVYMNGLLKNLGLCKIKCGAAAYFSDLNLGIGTRISGIMSSTMVELQAIALALECVPSDSSVVVYLDSQTALDACVAESALVSLDFYNCCWIEWCGIIKGHSGVISNECANKLANLAVSSDLALSVLVKERFVKAGGMAVFGNIHHFVCEIFRFVNCVYWKVGLDFDVINNSLLGDVDWSHTALVWHSDSHMVAGFINKSTASLCSYFLKALYHYLPVAVSDHFFVCTFDFDAHKNILMSYLAKWYCVSGLNSPLSRILQVLSLCVSDNVLYTTEAMSILDDAKTVRKFIVDFVWELGAAYHIDIWLVKAKYKALMEKNSLIPLDGSVYSVTYGLSCMFSAGVIRLFGIAEALGVCFGFCKHCCFFSGVDSMISVQIDL